MKCLNFSICYVDKIHNGGLLQDGDENMYNNTSTITKIVLVQVQIVLYKLLRYSLIKYKKIWLRSEKINPKFSKICSISNGQRQI
jgi:hypothetical protein